MSAAGAEDSQGAEGVDAGRLSGSALYRSAVGDRYPNLIRETGDKVEITERAERRIVFLIEKANRPCGRGPATVSAGFHGRICYLLPIDTPWASVPIRLSAGVRRSSRACDGAQPGAGSYRSRRALAAGISGHARG